MPAKPDAEKRPSGLMVALAFSVAVAAAAGLVIAALVLRGDGDAQAPASTPAIDLSSIPQNATELGAPTAQVTLIEYADLQCPACRNYATAVLPAIVDDYIRPGKVKAEFRGIAFIGADSERAVRLVYAAGLQNRLWQLQEALYRNQGGENSGWVTDDLIRELAAQIAGLDVDRLFTDADGAEVTTMVEEAAAQANAAEVGGTPTFAVRVGDAEPKLLELGISSTELFAALDDALAG